MSSHRLNSFAKRTQREVMQAREAAFAKLLGRVVACPSCSAEFTLVPEAYRGVAMRDRVQVEAVRYACPECGTEQAVPV